MHFCSKQVCFKELKNKFILLYLKHIVFRGLIHRPVARKNAHYPILILFSNVLCCNLKSKKSGQKKSLNTFSLAANILKWMRYCTAFLAKTKMLISCAVKSKKPFMIIEPLCEKTGLRGFRPGLTQTGLYSQRSRLEHRNFGFKKKKRNCTICVAKT